MKDYYQILGVERDANQDEIKKAFRRLARETHPDANPGDAAAEERFRQAAEAYEVLSDENRRALYDRGGGRFDAGDLFARSGNLADVFSYFFSELSSFGGGDSFSFFGSRGADRRGKDVLVPVEISLADAAHGTRRELEVAAAETCPACEGSGAPADRPPVTCPRCSGSGTVVTTMSFLGARRTVCDRCRGDGTVLEARCRECGGGGSVAGVHTLTVEIPAGIDHGARLRLGGRGGAGMRGGPAGDLYVQVVIQSDARFRRDGDTLVHTVHVNMMAAALGTTVTVPDILEDAFELDIPAGTQPGTVFRVARKGMPRLRRRGRGELLVDVIVQVPTRLNSEQRARMRDLLDEFDERAPVSDRRRGRRR